MNKLLEIIINFILNIFGINKNSSLSNKKGIANYEYKVKCLMTNYERYFYSILIELESELDIKVHPQLNLSSVIEKITKTKYQNELFRNIDFALFDKYYNKLLLLIEINDTTHMSKSRRERDQKVTDICAKANIKLIKFYSKYPNEKDYVKNRIKKELNNSSNMITTDINDSIEETNDNL